MKFRLHVSPAADRDVDELAAYIARDSIEQAIHFLEAADVTYRMILKDPTCWPVYEFDNPLLARIRKRSIIKFPNQLVFYRVDVDIVTILRVLHGARDLPAIFEEGKA